MLLENNSDFNMAGEPRPFEKKQEKVADLLRKAMVLESDMADVMRVANELKYKLDRNIDKAKAIRKEAEEFIEDFEKSS